jgi:hypothetical protein
MRFRVDGGEEGLAFFFGQVLDHHLIVRGQRAGAAQHDRQLEMLVVAVVCTVGRHGYPECTAGQVRSPARPPVRDQTAAARGIVSAFSPEGSCCAPPGDA